MQQQFFTLSPMAGQESFPNTTLDVRPGAAMAHTPTTSSMIAALQGDSFGSGTLDPTSTFPADAFGLPYIDGASSQDDLSVHTSGLSFPDYGSGTFEVPAFTPQDLGISTTGTPPSASSDPENESESVKAES